VTGRDAAVDAAWRRLRATGELRPDPTRYELAEAAVDAAGPIIAAQVRRDTLDEAITAVVRHGDPDRALDVLRGLRDEADQ
jgi:hypothetical protein